MSIYPPLQKTMLPTEPGVIYLDTSQPHLIAGAFTC